MTLYLSRLRLLRTPSVDALNTLIAPKEDGPRRDAQHRLIWSAFAGDPNATRDFLWRAEGRGSFLTLSSRPPRSSELFEPPQVCPFTPDLRPGDRLAFALRANATRTEKTGRTTTGGKEHKHHIDLVMDALKPVPQDARAKARMALAQQVAEKWLAAQGGRYGFTPSHVAVADYSVSVLPGYKGPRKGQPQFGILDLTGVLTVTEPEALIARIAAGFGRAKAFGCGLMLIRRSGG